MTFSAAPNPHNELNHVEVRAYGETGLQYEHGALLSNYCTYRAVVQA